LVSKPILVKAKANHNDCRFLRCPLSGAISPGCKKKEKNSETTTKPITNLGKRSQIILSVGFLLLK
jgi:hypothetical protein